LRIVFPGNFRGTGNGSQTIPAVYEDGNERRPVCDRPRPRTLV
jgi:hypothetical protein